MFEVHLLGRVFRGVPSSLSRVWQRLIIADKNGSSVKCVDAFRIALTEEPKLLAKQKTLLRLSTIYLIIIL